MAAEEMDIVSDDENEQADCSDQTVLNKYVLAGKIAQASLNALIQSVNENRDIADLCAKSDAFIKSQTDALFKKGDVARGIAFPTCISKNELAGHFAPLKDSNVDIKPLVDGDIIKVDLGVQIDGFAALVATTFQVGGGEISGKKADAVAAAWTAAECAIRLMKPGTTNTQITKMFQAVAEAFGCNCLEGVLSHELKRFVIDSDNTILSKENPESVVDEFALEPNKVYALDVVMSTGLGKAIRKDIYPTTIYKRVVENQYQLKRPSSREFLTKVNKLYPAYPFNLRNFQENQSRARLGLKECLSHELLSDYPILHEKDGEFIAQYKFTCIVRPNQGPLRICGTETLDRGLVKTDKVIKNEDLQKLLATTWQKKKKRKKKKKKSNNKAPTAV